MTAILALVSVFGLSALILLPACQEGPEPSSLQYAALIEADSRRLEAVEGERLPIRLTLTNLGQEAWDSGGSPPCFLSYHLMDQDRNMIRFDNRRIALPRRIESGEAVDLEVLFRVPFQSGNHILEFDLVREGVAWFKDEGAESLEIPLVVKERRWQDSEQEIGLEYGKYTRFTSSLPGIDQLYKLIRLTLEQNETTFSGRTGEISGFAPGKNYPQIWLRDAATIIPASRWFYSSEWLSSWLEEHLAFQRENGSLYDWIDSRGKADKNTTETDQEASAIQAAYQVYQILGPGWLRREVGGRTIIVRLEAALEFVQRERWEPGLGMIKGAHTADWGDVDIVDADQNAVYTDENTHWTVDIYDQSMFYQAARELADMLDSVREEDRAAAWREAASVIRKNTIANLWQEDRGFFAVHRHLDDLTHDFDEDDIFAMGGNAQAVLSGLADASQAQRIFQTALTRQDAHGVSTIAGTLLPPYPAGTFRHGLLDDPFEYQNGAQWDWFGGRLIYAMYENGYSARATEKLLQIIRKNIANRGFFEWDNREGVGRGSDIFCGSAGVLAKAVIEGFFGIKQGKESLNLEPRIGRSSAQIQFYIPSSDVYVAYEYQYMEQDQELRLKFESNSSQHGMVKILNPWPDLNTRDDLFSGLSVTLDRKQVDFSIEANNQDQYIIFATDFNPHQVVIHKK